MRPLHNYSPLKQQPFFFFLESFRFSVPSLPLSLSSFTTVSFPPPPPTLSSSLIHHKQSSTAMAAAEESTLLPLHPTT
eukprot:superscaffoldBa00000076_g1161